jgi:hypothetical protein
MSSNAIVVRKKVTTLDKIRKYYLKGEDSVTLTEKQDEVRVRIYKAWNLLINYHSKEQAMAVIMTEYGCSNWAVKCIFLGNQNTFFFYGYSLTNIGVMILQNMHNLHMY